MTHTTHTDDGHSIYRVDEMIPHGLIRVWRAMTDAEQLSQWYPAKATQLDARLGGTIGFVYPDATTSLARITAYDGPQLFAFEEVINGAAGPYTHQLRFETHPEMRGCLLVFRLTFADGDPGAGSYQDVWARSFFKLEKLLDDQYRADDKEFGKNQP